MIRAKSLRKAFFALMSVIVLINIMMVQSIAQDAVPNNVLKASNSVLRIIAEYDDGYSLGSGFIVAKDKDTSYLATNYHVISDSPSYICVIDSNGDEIKGSVFAYDSKKDIAIIKTDLKLQHSVLCLDADTIKKGDPIYAVGFPAAADDISSTVAYSNDDVTITDGIISSIREGETLEGATVNMVQISAPINSGNSGGPLLDQKGHVVGINTYGSSETVEGINWAIKIDEVIDLLQSKDIKPTTPTKRIPVGLITPIICVIVLSGFILLLIKKKIPFKTVIKKPKAKKEREPTNNVPPILYCRHCGKKIIPGTSFCNHCGTKL